MEVDFSNDLDKDIIKEVGSILANNSANAFSTMIKDSMKLKTEISLIQIEDFKMEFIMTHNFVEIFQDLSKNIVEGFFLKTSKGVDGVSIILFEQEQVGKIVNSIMSIDEEASKDVPEQEKADALKEFSNIIINAYLNALSKLVHIDIDTSMPIPAKDILGTLYEFKEKLKNNAADKMLMIKTDILADESKIKGQLMMIFEQETLNQIMTKLRG